MRNWCIHWRVFPLQHLLKMVKITHFIETCCLLLDGQGRKQKEKSVEDSVLNMNCHKTSECMIIKTSTKCSVHLTVLFNLQSMRTSTSPAKRTVFMCMMGCQILCQLQIATRVMCWVCSAVWTPLTQWLWKPSLVRPKPG